MAKSTLGEIIASLLEQNEFEGTVTLRKSGRKTVLWPSCMSKSSSWWHLTVRYCTKGKRW